MGFIDWLKKDKDVKEIDEDEIVDQEQEEEIEDNSFDEDDDLSSLKELSNSEREQSLGFGEDEENEEDNNNPFGVQQNNDSYNSYSNNNFMPQQNASFTIFKVGDEEDVRQVLKHLSSNAPCIASFDRLKKKEYNLIMKYLQGGLFVMGANMSEWQNNSYILVPRGMAINMQEKSRRKK